jgi:hypothetical protein
MKKDKAENNQAFASASKSKAKDNDDQRAFMTNFMKYS